MSMQHVRRICCAGVLGCVAAVAGAQAGGDLFVTPIPGAQFSGTVRIDRLDINPTGASTIPLWSERQIARDSAGRIHNESRPFLPVAISRIPPASVIHLYDPQNRMSEYLYPQTKTYRMTILNRPPATDPPDNFAASSAASVPLNELTRQDELGYRTIAGLQAHGVRITQTLPPAESGTGQEVVVTNEYWYSEELRLNLMTTHNDPRTGSVTMQVTQIDRGEPNAVLFSVPADYKMQGLER